MRRPKRGSIGQFPTSLGSSEAIVIYMYIYMHIHLQYIYAVYRCFEETEQRIALRQQACMHFSNLIDVSEQ